MSVQEDTASLTSTNTRLPHTGHKVERKKPFRFSRPAVKDKVVIPPITANAKSISSNKSNKINGQSAGATNNNNSVRIDKATLERNLAFCNSNESFSLDPSHHREKEIDNEEERDIVQLTNSYNKHKGTPESPVHKDTILKVYEIACKKYKAVPSTVIKNGLHSRTLACKFMQLQDEDVQAICVAVAENPFVEELDFQNNSLGPNSAKFISEIIRASNYLTHIKLAENNLGHEGAVVICEAVRQNNTIIHLDLSGNGFTERDGELFQKIIEDSDSIEEIHLGHNNMMEIGAMAIAHALRDNNSLKVLDLHWNNIRLKGAVAIGNAMQHNTTVVQLDLSWNGLHVDGTKAMSKALEKNETLLDLNLTNNRLTEECIAELIKGLKKNTALRVLRIGRNNISPKGAMSILQLIGNNLNSGLTLLDFGNQNVHDDFEQFAKHLRERQNLQVLHGPVWKLQRGSIASADEDENELRLLHCDPMLVVMECIRLLNYRLLDSFHFADTDTNMEVDINEICDCMLKMKVPLHRHTLLKLLRALDDKTDNKLDFKKLVEEQQKHRKQVRKYLQEDIDFDGTDIGKISLHLRKIMGNDFVKYDRNYDQIGDCMGIKSPEARRRQKSKSAGANEKRAVIFARRLTKA